MSAELDKNVATGFAGVSEMRVGADGVSWHAGKARGSPPAAAERLIWVAQERSHVRQEGLIRIRSTAASNLRVNCIACGSLGSGDVLAKLTASSVE